MQGHLEATFLKVERENPEALAYRTSAKVSIQPCVHIIKQEARKHHYAVLDGTKEEPVPWWKGLDWAVFHRKIVDLVVELRTTLLYHEELGRMYIERELADAVEYLIVPEEKNNPRAMKYREENGVSTEEYIVRERIEKDAYDRIYRDYLRNEAQASQCDGYCRGRSESIRKGAPKPWWNGISSEKFHKAIVDMVVRERARVQSC